MWVRLSLANAEANAVRIDKDRITSHRLSLSLSPSLQTDVATYRVAYGLSPLSIISLWIKVPRGLAPDPARHITSAELYSHQPRLLVGRGRHHLATKHFQWDPIRKRWIGLFLVTDCGGFAVSPRSFHTPVCSKPHSRESPSIGSSLTFEGHISQSCGTDIHSVHSFFAGIRRLILSAAAWGIHPSPYMGIDASIEPPAFIHRFIGHYILRKGTSPRGGQSRHCWLHYTPDKIVLLIHRISL